VPTIESSLALQRRQRVRIRLFLFSLLPILPSQIIIATSIYLTHCKTITRCYPITPLHCLLLTSPLLQARQQALPLGLLGPKDGRPMCRQSPRHHRPSLLRTMPLSKAPMSSLLKVTSTPSPGQCTQVVTHDGADSCSQFDSEGNPTLGKNTEGGESRAAIAAVCAELTTSRSQNNPSTRSDDGRSK